MEQSMTMSMYSSITPDDFHGGADEDVFGKIQVIISYVLIWPKNENDLKHQWN